MTDAFTKWVKELQSKTPYHYCGPDDAEHFIRAFVALVNERAKDKTNCTSLYMAFNDVVRELLGE